MSLNPSLRWLGRTAAVAAAIYITWLISHLEIPPQINSVVLTILAIASVTAAMATVTVRLLRPVWAQLNRIVAQLNSIEGRLAVRDVRDDTTEPLPMLTAAALGIVRVAGGTAPAAGTYDEGYVDALRAKAPAATGAKVIPIRGN